MQECSKGICAYVLATLKLQHDIRENVPEVNMIVCLKARNTHLSNHLLAMNNK